MPYLQTNNPVTRSKFLKFVLPTAVLIMLTFSLLLPNLVQAATSIEDRLQKVGAQVSTTQTPSLAGTVGGIIKTTLSIVGALFMIYIIYAGFLWLTAAGKEDNIVKAKTIIRGSIIGLIIVLAAYLITATVVDRLIGATGYKTAPESPAAEPEFDAWPTI